MRTFISVENHKAQQFEHTLEEFDNNLSTQTEVIIKV